MGGGFGVLGMGRGYIEVGEGYRGSGGWNLENIYYKITDMGSSLSFMAGLCT